jgi:hypothetical protein
MPMLMGSEMALKAIQIVKNSIFEVTGMFDFAPLQLSLPSFLPS